MPCRPMAPSWCWWREAWRPRAISPWRCRRGARGWCSTSSTIRPTRMPITSPPAPRSGARARGRSLTSSRPWAPRAPSWGSPATSRSRTRRCRWSACNRLRGARSRGSGRWPAAYLPAIFEPARVDRVLDVTQQEALAMMRRLAREEGSAAGSARGRRGRRLAGGGRDQTGGGGGHHLRSGDRYLSTGVFSDEQARGPVLVR